MGQSRKGPCALRGVGDTRYPSPTHNPPPTHTPQLGVEGGMLMDLLWLLHKEELVCGLVCIMVDTVATLELPICNREIEG